MTDSTEALQAAAIIGDEARRFMESELGRTICGLAEHEAADALDELIKADPADLAKVRAVQLKAAMGVNFKAWLIDLINDGEESLAVLKQQRQG